MFLAFCLHYQAAFFYKHKLSLLAHSPSLFEYYYEVMDFFLFNTDIHITIILCNAHTPLNLTEAPQSWSLSL